MSKITCAAIDCKYIDDNHRCKSKEIHLSEQYINTVHEGMRHFWTCKMYEQDKTFEQYLMEIMGKDKVNV